MAVITATTMTPRRSRSWITRAPGTPLAANTATPARVKIIEERHALSHVAERLSSGRGPSGAVVPYSELLWFSVLREKLRR